MSLPTQPIPVAHLLAPLHDELVALLRGIGDDEWNAPTSAGAWTVKDVTAHLLDTTLRRLVTKARATADPRGDGDVRFAEPLLRMICVIG